MNELKFALRQLLKNPGFTAVAVLTLAPGMGANTAFFSVFHGVVLQDPPFPGADRLVEIRNYLGADASQSGRLSLAELFDYRERQRSLVGIGASIRGRATLTSGQGADRIQLTRITANVFPLLGVSPARGRNITEAEERAGEDTSVLVSHDFWQSHLGGIDEVLGLSIELNGAGHTIIGVMPPGFSYPSPGISIWKPLDLTRRGKADREDHSLQTIARLAPGVTVAQARSDLMNVSRQLQAEQPAAYPGDGSWRVGFESLRASQFGHMKEPLGLLATAAAAVLLIASVNVAIMFLLRSTVRRREMFIRSALGADRSHLVRQLLTESVLVCGLGALGGLVIAGLGLEAFKALSAGTIPRLQEVGMNGAMAAFIGGVLILVTLIVGLAPATSVTKAGSGVGSGASGRATEGRAAGRLRDALTVTEIALAVVLLVSAGLTFRSLQSMLRVDLGFATDRLLTFKTNLTPQGHPDAASANRFYDLLSAKIESLPGVTAVGAVSYLPLSGEAQYMPVSRMEDVGFRQIGTAPAEVGWRVVRGQYFEAMKMTLLRGRQFTPADRDGAPPVAIVDDDFARRFWETEDAAIGQRLRFGDAASPDIRTVVGVIRGVKHFGPGATSLPEAYVPQAQAYQRGMYTVVQAGSPAAELAPLIRARLAEVDPSVPMYFTETLEQRRRTVLTLPRFTAGLIGAFSTLALVLAGVGIFGVTAYSVGQRTREFGIRLSLGAQRFHVAGLVLKRVVQLALLGVAIGVPGALGVATLMKSLLFGVTPIDPVTLAGTAASLGLTVLAASLVPLFRAVRVSPVEALKAD